MEQERTAAPEGPQGPGGGRRYRWAKPVIVFLLIAIPAGYLYISAMQSRGGSESKKEQAAASGLEEGWPSRLQRRIYEVWIPPYSEDVAHYETNSWKASSLYVQFTTTRDGLQKFLARTGNDMGDLADGEVTIGEDEAAEVGWNLGAGHHWAGLELEHDKPQPSLEITANLDNPQYPKVYLVSTTTP
ncbi:hypothetical protein [Streptomyces sp. ISL-11]|uniref:hypothetical protein n=1 Tax=Streptomyces sp. ISL-11 TaxID=2819174 RepID=UPI001BEC74E5|nr:hypothetical protein [Streptomyces sp. ISL-11]MBT2385096.1 hypothetical protein [Streptomyces sp. ISL-11]